MNNKEIIELLQKKLPEVCCLTDYYSDLLSQISKLKNHYDNYMTTAPVSCDEELKRLPTADYDLCCALFTMLLREDHFSQYGCFDRRYKNGDVGKIIDRMITVLKDEIRNSEVDEIKPGRYHHYKGNEYEVLYTAQHSETEEEMVVYRALYGEHKIWVRPASMWNEIVEINGERKKRFAYLPME